jgi:hypothetical protein
MKRFWILAMLGLSVITVGCTVDADDDDHDRDHTVVIKEQPTERVVEKEKAPADNNVKIVNER